MDDRLNISSVAYDPAVKHVHAVKDHVLFRFEREKERESVTREGQRERERENPKQALCCQRAAPCRARTHKP